MARPSRSPPSAESAELLPPDDAGERITQFFSSLGADSAVAVSVYAIDPKNRLARSFLFELPDVAELRGPQLMSQVLEKYGPGEYLAEGRNPNGTIAFNPRFTVGPVKSPRAEIPDPRPAAAPSSPAPTSELAALTAFLQRQTALLEQLVSRPQPTLLEQLEQLKALREAFAPPAPPPAPAFEFGKVLELVKGVIDLRDTLGDAAGGGEGGPFGVLARTLAPALTKITERALEQPPPAALPASPSVPNPSPPAAPAGDDTMAASNTMLKAYVAQLIELAEQGMQPAAAAERVARTLAGFPEPMIAAVLEWLNDEQVVDELAKLDHRAKHYAPWLEQTIDALLDTFMEDDESPPPASVNASPAATN